MTDELKPCPWCNVVPEQIEYQDDNVSVDCVNDDCKINPRTLYGSRQEVVAAWNTRQNREEYATISLNKGDLVTKVSWCDYDGLSKYKWYAGNGNDDRYYVRRNVIKDSTSPRTTVSMHRQIMGVLDTPNIKIDHVNGDPLDNRRENLRCCNNSQNQMNVMITGNGTSEYKGVDWYEHSNGWRVCIKDSGKKRSVTRINSEDIASIIYDLLAVDTFGDFSRVNHPELMEYIKHNYLSLRKPEEK